MKAAETRGEGYATGYIFHIGPNYIDALDADGRLRLADGKLLNVHGFTDADWAEIGKPGVGWQGCANLSRFVNHASSSNTKMCRGWLVTTRAIEAGEELFLNYGKDYWGGKFEGLGHARE